MISPALGVRGPPCIAHSCGTGRVSEELLGAVGKDRAGARQPSRPWMLTAAHGTGEGMAGVRNSMRCIWGDAAGDVWKGR